ncbi:MAG: hypothetical protein KAR20_01710, partial [Candidatus Heimdallarchaeota archaeon]|nr:hypothetical protein [Candidatus Heimdallarchaeota archaeon]
MSWLNCGVSTQAIWPEQQKEIKYGNNTFILMPLTKEYSASVHIELNNISEVEGLTLINRYLSAIGWKCDEPTINHYGWSGSLNPQPVLKHQIPYGYSSSEIFPNEVHEIIGKKAKLAVALYREARSLESVPYQFLSYFKILN